MTVLRRLMSSAKCPPILMVSGYYLEDEIREDAWRFGASAVAYKPFLNEVALAAALRVVIDGDGESPLLHVRPDALGGLHDRADRQPGLLISPSAHGSLQGIVAVSRPMREVIAWIALAARTDSAVLLMGETGVGKELVAHAIHRLSRRRERPLVTLNCASVDEALVESEFFGHRKGAFTSALPIRPEL